MKLSKLALTLAISCLALNSCYLLKKDFEPFTSVAPTPIAETTPELPPKSLTEVEVKALPARPTNKNDSITIKWLVPEHSLDGYVIRYGFSSTELGYEERVRWNQLTIDSEPSGKRIFIHTLRGLDAEKTVFLSLAGIKDDQLSPPTAIFSVQPTSQTEPAKESPTQTPVPIP